MQINKNGIRIETPQPKKKQRTRLNHKLEMVPMLLDKQRVLVPKFPPVVRFLKSEGYRRERAK